MITVAKAQVGVSAKDLPSLTSSAIFDSDKKVETLELNTILGFHISENPHGKSEEKTVIVIIVLDSNTELGGGH